MITNKSLKLQQVAPFLIRAASHRLGQPGSPVDACRMSLYRAGYVVEQWLRVEDPILQGVVPVTRVFNLIETLEEDDTSK